MAHFTRPQIVCVDELVVDFALPLTVTKVATVYYAYDEQDESWEGAGYFNHLDDALWTTARHWANEEYGYDIVPPEKTSWRRKLHVWRLYDGNSATDIVVSDSPLLASEPDEQPQPVSLTADELAELTASIEHLSGPDAWDEARLELALIPVTHYVPRLLAMVAKGQPQDDGDVRAVAALLDKYRGGGTIAECKREFNALTARFADRIAALDAHDTKAAAPTTGWILWDAEGRWRHTSGSASNDGWRAVSINDAEAEEWQHRGCILDRLDEAGWRAFNEGDKSCWQFEPGSRDEWLAARDAKAGNQ